MRTLLLALTFALTLSAQAVQAASQDGNVEWAGLSHEGWQDRRPLCPIAGESFAVRFQSWRNDLTAANVVVTVGGTPLTIPAAVVGQRGPYDVWQATVPATSTTSESYWIEAVDGADADYLSLTGVTDGVPADGGWLLDFATLAHAPLGATPTTGGGAVFKVWAPTRTGCDVRGTFNNWSTTNPMNKVGEYFVSWVPVVADTAQYKYFFNNAVWNTDPGARAIDPTNGNFNAIVEDPFRYAWQSPLFTAPPFEKLVVYQVHVGTFAGLNDPLGSTPFPSGYVDVAARLDHLHELGVNAIQICPITEFPGDLSAGYNPQTQFAPEWKYGTPDQLKQLVDRAHQLGIAVLLDVVWNHFTTSDNWLWNYDGSQQWFDTPPIDTPWGSQADFDRPAVRDYFANSAQLWLDEYRVDGFRMDATDYMNIGAQAAAGWSLMQRLNDEVDRRFADKFTIAEQLPNDDYVSRPTSLGGAGFDAQYHMKWRDNLRGAVFAAASGDPSMAAVRDALLGSGPYISGTHALNYVELHDEAWPSSGGQRLVKTIDTTAPHDDMYARGRTKLVFGLTLVSPGVPEILQGTEWLEDTDFGADAVNRIDWSKKTTYRGIFDYYRDLIATRAQHEALDADGNIYVSHVNEGGNVIAYRRWKGDDQVMVLANFSNTTFPSYRIGLPAPGNWQERVNSQNPAYMGSGPINAGTFAADAQSADGFAQSAAVTLPAMALLVLAPATTTDAPAGGPPALQLAAAPAVHRGRTTLSFMLPAAAHVRLTILDAAGRRVATLVDDVRPAGTQQVIWQAGRASAGLYFAHLETPLGEATARLVRLR